MSDKNQEAISTLLNLPEVRQADTAQAGTGGAMGIDKKFIYNLALLIVLLFSVIPLAVSGVSKGWAAMDTYFAGQAVFDARDKTLALVDEIEGEDGLPFPPWAFPKPDDEKIQAMSEAEIQAAADEYPQEKDAVRQVRSAAVEKWGKAIDYYVRVQRELNDLPDTNSAKSIQRERLTDEIKTYAKEEVNYTALAGKSDQVAQWIFAVGDAILANEQAAESKADTQPTNSQ